MLCGRQRDPPAQPATAVQAQGLSRAGKLPGCERSHTDMQSRVEFGGEESWNTAVQRLVSVLLWLHRARRCIWPFPMCQVPEYLDSGVWISEMIRIANRKLAETIDLQFDKDDRLT